MTSLPTHAQKRSQGVGQREREIFATSRFKQRGLRVESRAMPLWTNGPAYVIATGWGVARCEGDAKPQVTRWSTEGLKRDQEPPDIELFAVLDEDGRHALVRREGEPCQLWSAGGSFDPIEGVEILDAVGLGESSILAAVGEGDRVVLRRAKIEKKKIALGDPVPLPAAARAKWPSSLWEKGEEPWPEQDDDRDENEAPFDPTALSLRSKVTTFWLGRVRLVQNRCGIAVTSTYNGLGALLDPKTLAPRACVRVPCDPDEIEVFGLAVPQGLLLTLVSNERNTEYVLIGAGGEVVAHKNKMGKETASGATNAGLLWSDEKVLVNQNESSPALYFLALPGLAPKQFGKDEVNVVGSCSSPDGAQHVVATAGADGKLSSWKLLRYDPNAKKVKGENLPMPDFKPPPPPLTKPEKRKRAEGSPVLAMKPDAATPWRATVKELTALRLQVMNRGGPLSGMYVELAGNAVSDALVEGEEATLGGAKARFERKGSAFRCEISEAHLDAHFADASRGDPAPSIDLVIRIRAQRAGNALMTVRVGPIGATGIMGSAMEGRSFVVVAA
jgi:hypothetical protein